MNQPPIMLFVNEKMDTFSLSLLTPKDKFTA